MKPIITLLGILLLAGCESSAPRTPTVHQVTFDGEYIDARNGPEAIKARPLHKTPPRVPSALRKEGVDAAAVIAFMVEKDGTTSHPQVVSSTNDEFAEIACQSVLQWRYAPPTKDGKVVRMVLQEPFSLSFQTIYP